MARIQATISTVTATLQATDAAAIALVRGYCRVHDAPVELTDPEKLEWFLRHLVQRAKADVDELEIGEAARDAAQASREARAAQVFG